MIIKGQVQTINKNQEELFKFLSDFRNFKELMPPEVKGWKAEEDHCSFEIGGMVTVELRMTEKKVPSYLKINSEGKTPFPFILHTHLNKVSESQTKNQFEIDAKVSPIMKMMVKGPLENLVKMMDEKLKELFN